MDDEAFLGIDESVDDLDIEGLEEVEYAVRLSNVSRTYTLGTREVTALNNVNLEVRSGDYVVVHGPSGSGKTTLLNIIGCIDLATSGRVLVMDVPIGDYDESFRATFRLANTGFVFQSYNLISTLTAIENVMFPMQLQDHPESELRDEGSRLLDLVNLGERQDHLPWQLSSGEQQRVAIARALANDPPVLLADEPTANLDQESAQMIRDILSGLNSDGRTVIVMTHDPAIISHTGTRRFTMSKGELSAIE
ncbi:ABC transporter ATP-binding protein [Candidatus Thorarchaeota archaeon]|nr:MAG: ABC transporter ATP-binding protein [Candidatus Thorarchaeota archaeon]